MTTEQLIEEILNIPHMGQYTRSKIEEIVEEFEDTDEAR
jgi:uncharacterized protein (UPF0147 family)